MITYGGLNEAKTPTYTRRFGVEMNEAQRVKLMRTQTIKEIQVLEDKLEAEKKKLKQYNKQAVSLIGKQVEENMIVPMGEKVSKRNKIIACYEKGNTVENICQITQTTPSYVYKVLSEYRKEKGLDKVGKGQFTRNSIKYMVSIGASSRDIALHLGISVQYVNRVKKSLDS